MEKPMLYSIVTPIVVFLLALGVSYFITRPIGDRRRHIAAAILAVVMGTIGGFLVANMLVAIFVALGGAFAGMMIAWRRRNPLAEHQTQSKTRKQGSKRPHYGISRA
jgi:predicted PurR-regulated permease PerM